MPSRAARRHPDRHQNMDSPSIALCVLHPGEVAGDFAASLHDMLAYDANHQGMITKHGDRIFMESSPRLAEARCALVRLVLKEKFTHMMCIDADMSFPREAPYAMIQTMNQFDAGIVGGLCFAGGRGSHDMYPTMYVLDPDPDKGVKLQMNKIERYPREGVVQVDATGAAALMIRRDVLEKMGQVYARNEDGRPNLNPWFADGFHAGMSYGEDIVFCIRARQLGFKIMIDTRVKFGHVKKIVLDEDMYREMLMRNSQEDLAIAGTEKSQEEVFNIAGPIAEMFESHPSLGPEPEPELEEELVG